MPPGTRYDSTAPPLAPQPSAGPGARARRPPSACYLVWRWGFTLGGSLWLGLPLILAETYGLVMLVLLAFSCWRRPTGPAPAARGPRRRRPDRDLRRGRGCCARRSSARWPSATTSTRRSGCSTTAPAWVREMCDELGARYLCRPAPRRTPRPATSTTPSVHVDAEFLVTLDADHVPRPELLERMLGYMADPEVAVVQGPQAFYNRGFGHPRDARRPPAQRAEHLLRRHLPREGPPRRRLLVRLPVGAPPRRRSTTVGGVATDTVVEDAHTSLRLHRRGWRGRLPRRGHGARPGARGDRRLRGPARPLGPRLAADAAARPARCSSAA